MLRRRRRDGGDQPDDADEDYGFDEEPEDQSAGWAAGPWDAGDDYPEGERIDCGSLLIPLREGFDVQIHMADEQGVWVTVLRDESGMQLQAFAAPKSGGLWEEVRGEIAENITASGGGWEEAKGAAGAELRARVPVSLPGPEPRAGELQPVRFLGADGPRWFLRGVISGPAALDDAAAGPFAEIFADVVVVRGDYPAPPKEPLEIRLPEAAKQALEAGLAQEEPGWGLQNPFERGPEITEIR